MILNNITFVCENFKIQPVVEEVLSMISENLSMEQQSRFNQWDVRFENINPDDMTSVFFSDLEDFTERFIEPMVEVFDISIDFSFLKNKVVQNLSESEIIKILRIANIDQDETEELSYKINIDMIITLLEIANMGNPVSTGETIIDLDHYKIIYEDGRFSNERLEIYFSPTTKRLLLHKWSMWQGGEDYYKSLPLKDYLPLMFTGDHPERAIEGFKQILSML